MRTIKKSLIVISLLAVIIAIPLTVFISQQQQEIRQRASGKDAAVFFAELGSVSPIALSQISLSPGQQKIIALYLDTDNIPISGYDIIISFGTMLQSITVNEIAEGADADKLGSLLSKDFNQTTGKIRFARISPPDALQTISSGKLHLGSIAFTVKPDASGTGSIDIAYAEIISPGRDKLTVDLSALPFAIGSSPSPTPITTGTATPTVTQTLSPTPTPTPQTCRELINSECAPPNLPAIVDYSLVNGEKPENVDCTICRIGNIFTCKKVISCSPDTVSSNSIIPTPTPTPTLVPGSTTVKLKTGGAFGLETIFKLPKDTTPFAKKDQSLIISLYKSTDDPSVAAAVAQSAATLSYNTAQNKFANEHAFNFTGSIPTGTYKILLKSPKYLRKNIGSLTVVSGGPNTFDLNSNVTLADGAGDVNNDNVLDIADYNVILACFGDKTCFNKEAADLNEDGKVDGIDINIFITGLSFTSRKGD